MGSLPKTIILAAMIAVAIVLALGLINMAKGGSMSTSQKLMRWRVALQFLAIVIIMTAIYLTQN
jgi:archaellin